MRGDCRSNGRNDPDTAGGTHADQQPVQSDDLLAGSPRSDRSGVGLKEGLLLTDQGISFEDPRWTEYAIDLRRDWAMGDPIPGWNGTVSWNCTSHLSHRRQFRHGRRGGTIPQTVSAPPGTQLGIGVLNMSYNDLHVVSRLGRGAAGGEELHPPEGDRLVQRKCGGSHNVTMVPAWAANSEMTADRWNEWNKNSIATVDRRRPGHAVGRRQCRRQFRYDGASAGANGCRALADARCRVCGRRPSPAFSSMAPMTRRSSIRYGRFPGTTEARSSS